MHTAASAMLARAVARARATPPVAFSLYAQFAPKAAHALLNAAVRAERRALPVHSRAVYARARVAPRRSSAPRSCRGSYQAILFGRRTGRSARTTVSLHIQAPSWPLYSKTPEWPKLRRLDGFLLVAHLFWCDGKAQEPPRAPPSRASSRRTAVYTSAVIDAEAACGSLCSYLSAARLSVCSREPS